MPHNHGKGNQVKSFHHVAQALLIAHEPPEATHPAKASLDHPPPREQHEAALDVRYLDDLQRNPVGGGGLPSRRSGLARVDIGQGDRLPGRLLDCACQLGDLCPVLRVRYPIPKVHNRL